MLKKRFLVVAFAATVALSLVGSAMAQDKTVIRLWTGSSSPAENVYKEDQVAAFEEANPDIDVELLISPDYGTQIQAGFASGDYPEVFSVGQDQFPVYRDSGVLAEGQEFIEDIDGIYPSLLNAFTFEDVAYCVPKDFSTLALYYNKDMFDAAGLEYPTAEWTWQDMTDAAAALTTEDVVGFSASEDYNRWMGLVFANGGSLFDADGVVAINSPAAVEALDFYASFVADGTGALPSTLESGWNGEAFGKAKAAMTIEGNWALGYLDDGFADVNYGVAEIPTAPTGDKSTLVFTECWAVGANVEGVKQEAAWKLVNFLTSEEAAAALGEAGFGPMPSRSSAGESWLAVKGDNGAAFVAGAEYATTTVWPLGYADFVSVIGTGQKAVLEGTTTAQELLDEAAEVATEIQAELK